MIRLLCFVEVVIFLPEAEVDNCVVVSAIEQGKRLTLHPEAHAIVLLILFVHLKRIWTRVECQLHALLADELCDLPLGDCISVVCVINHNWIFLNIIVLDDGYHWLVYLSE
jgi:hypothetical protein